MRFLEQTLGVTPASLTGEQKKAYEGLASALDATFTNSLATLKKVAAAQGTAAFCVMQGNAGSAHVPWVIVAKSPSAAAEKLKAARVAIKAAGTHFDDLFHGGRKFAKGSVSLDAERRATMTIVDGTLPETLLRKMLATPAPAFKQEPTVKKVLGVLGEATFVSGEASSHPSAEDPTTPRFAELTTEELAEIFDRRDLEDLAAFTNTASAWTTALQGMDDEFDEETSKEEELLPAMLEAFLTAADPDEQGDLWLKYRKVASTDATELTAGATVSASTWLEANAPLVAEIAVLRRKMLNCVDAREVALNGMKQLRGSGDGSREAYIEHQQTFRREGAAYRELAAGFRQRLASIGERLEQAAKDGS